jgi:hypothetical protein
MSHDESASREEWVVTSENKIETKRLRIINTSKGAVLEKHRDEKNGPVKTITVQVLFDNPCIECGGPSISLTYEEFRKLSELANEFFGNV